MNIKAIRFTQNDNVLFVFVAKASDIEAKFDISRRKDQDVKNSEGYQRSFTKSRINKLKNYLQKERGIIPNSILVNIDTGKFSYNEETYTLNLKNEDSIGFIIDGQHRLLGSIEAGGSIMLPVVATVNLSAVEQAQLFITINSTQKGVPTSLYLDLLDLTEGEVLDFDDESIGNLTERRAVEIAKRLNDDRDSPLFELINTVGERSRGISLKFFSDTLAEYVDNKHGKFLQYGFEQQYSIFKIFFNAIKAVFNEIWERDNSPFFKTVGFGALMKALYEIFVYVTQKKGSFSTNNAIEIISMIRKFDFDTSKYGSGFRAQDNLAKAIVAELKQTAKDTNNTITIED